MFMRYLLLLQLVVVFSGTALATEGVFSTGPIFADYGPVADIDVTWSIAPKTAFKHSFDVSTQADEGMLNRSLVSAARFINMHARTGVRADRIQVAIVVHGKATLDMADEMSVNAALIAALVDQGVQIIVCGQSAAHYDVTTDDLLPGVQMALSAMTAHSVLQQQGYTLNPF
jgi:intracellular sulfur oxidation DsrE/DsrF family protein